MAAKKTTSLMQIRDALNSSFKERGALVDGMLTAIVARENLFILGPPGTAKSAICEALCGALQGKFFSWMLTKFSTPEELFGPPSLNSLKADKYKRITTGKLPEADIAFVDEIFKGSSAIQNTLLPVINERKFYNDGAPTNIPLISLIAASNELPQAEELAALYDRFALRYEVDRMQNDASAADLFKNGLKMNIPSISLADLAKEQTAAANVVVPDAIVKLLVQIRNEVAALQIYVSDRKWVQSVRVVKAFAHINGHNQVEETDLEILENMLWSEPTTQKAQIRKVIAKVANPLGSEIMKITDSCQEIFAMFKKDPEKNNVETNKKLKDGIKRLRALGDVKKNPKLEEAVNTLQTKNLEVLKYMGFEGIDNS